MISTNPALMIDLKCPRELESRVVLRDGHYEIALPLKDCNALVPNNRQQAEQRAHWLMKI